jgi:hypothetical protein
MSFQKRILEEQTFGEKAKEFAKNHAALLAGGAGAGLGALTAYLAGAPDEWHAERDAELNNYVNGGYKDDINIDSNLVDKDKFAEAVARAKGSWFSFDSTDAEYLKNLAQQDPRFNTLNAKNELVDPDVVMNNVEVQGYKINPNVDMEHNWNAYTSHIKQTMGKDMPSFDEAKANPEIAKKFADLKNASEHATRDAYLGYAAGGAALGAGLHQGGKFAKRKLDEKNRY